MGQAVQWGTSTERGATDDGDMPCRVGGCQREGKQPFAISLRGRKVEKLTKSQGKTKSGGETKTTGLLLLVLAQLLAAIMGLYTELTYKAYTSAYHENLFYSHFLGLPLFLPWSSSLRSQFSKLEDSAPLFLFRNPFPSIIPSASSAISRYGKAILYLKGSPGPSGYVLLPTQIANLGLNALTQFVCISGVNMLASRTSALSVSIVLNLRKLVSLILSIYIFGNSLPVGVVIGAVVVFGSVGLWGWEGQRPKTVKGVRGDGRRGKRSKEN